MNIFISWSGNTSLKIAEEIKSFLEITIQATNPWMSSKIEKGNRWNSVIAEQLAISNFGIICLTKDNLTSPWILFEAGALSKLNSSNVTAVLFDVEYHEIGFPLAQFQHTKFEKGEIFKLLRTINLKISDEGEKSLSDENLLKIFETNWSKFEEKIKNIILEKTHNIERSNEDKLNELIVSTRYMESVLEQFRTYSTFHKIEIENNDGVIEEIEVENSHFVIPIHRIQIALQNKGYLVPISGLMGEETRNAIIEYQRINDLPIGSLNKETLKSLGL